MIVSGLLFALLLGAFIFFILPRGSAWQRTASAVIFVMLVSAVYAGSVEMMSRPKPLRLEWRNPAKAKVVGASLQEGKAIYVWLQVGDSLEPRAYVLPWSTKMAEQLQKAMRQGQASGTGVEVSHPFGANEPGTDGAEARFYARPQPSMPAKNYGPEQPVIYRQPASTGTQ